MQIAEVRIFEVLVIGALRLIARMSFARAAICGAFVGAAGTILHLVLLSGMAPDPLVLALLTAGSASLGASVGMKLPALCRGKLRRYELSGPLGAAWNKLTWDVQEMVNRDDLFEDPKGQRLIEAYADAFADFPVNPQYARERMLEAITLSEELLEGSRQ